MAEFKVVVGSENPAKIEAATIGFNQGLPENTWRALGVAVTSQVSRQPMSSKEGKMGALNRAAAALKEYPDARYGVGMESALEDEGEDGWFDSGWICVMRGSDRVHSFGSTIRMHVPALIMVYIQEYDMELGEVDDLLFGQTNSKQQGGHFALATNYALTRTTAYVAGTVAALTRFIHPELYPIA